MDKLCRNVVILISGNLTLIWGEMRGYERVFVQEDLCSKKNNVGYSEENKSLEGQGRSWKFSQEARQETGGLDQGSISEGSGF